MVEYISPILGDIPEEIYNRVVTFKATGYKSLLNAMKRDFGYGYLRTGVLYLETEFIEPVTLRGTEIHDVLALYGFPSQRALDITRIFAANRTLVDDIIEKGFSVDDVAYGLDLKERLRELGLASRTVTTWFALESKITVYPVKEVEEYIPPPPEIVLWHPFLAGILITCDTWVQAKKRRQVRSLEARGKFEARKRVIIPEFQIEEAVIKILQDYILSIESQGMRNYESLIEDCGDLTIEPATGYIHATELLGYDSLEEQKDIVVYEDDEADKVTEIAVELWDVNYKKLRDTRVVRVTGRWWG